MKTNTVLKWYVLTAEGTVLHSTTSRRLARSVKNLFNSLTPQFGAHRIAKMVVTK